MISTQPRCYSFGFAPQLVISENTTLENVFQFVLTKDFRDYLFSDYFFLHERFKDMIPEDMLFVIQTTIAKDFVLQEQNNREPCFHFNMVIPKPNDTTDKTLSDYLQGQVLFLEHCFRYLSLGAFYFSETSKGQELLKTTSTRQEMEVVLNSKRFLSIELSLRVSRILNVAMMDPRSSEIVTDAISSILKLLDERTSLQVSDQVEVSLRREYMQIQIFGDRCCMYIDGSSLSSDSGWKIEAVNLDCPLQTIAMLAGIGVLFANN